MFLIEVKNNSYSIRKYNNDNIEEIEKGILCITPTMGIIKMEEINYFINTLKIEEINYLMNILYSKGKIYPNILKMLLTITKKEIERAFSYLEISPINIPNVNYNIGIILNLNNEDISSMHILLDYLLNKANREGIYSVINNLHFILQVYFILYTVIFNNMIILETNELFGDLN
jgi:hypothetical protein